MKIFVEENRVRAEAERSTPVCPLPGKEKSPVPSPSKLFLPSFLSNIFPFCMRKRSRKKKGRRGTYVTSPVTHPPCFFVPRREDET